MSDLKGDNDYDDIDEDFGLENYLAEHLPDKYSTHQEDYYDLQEQLKEEYYDERQHEERMAFWVYQNEQAEAQLLEYKQQEVKLLEPITACLTLLHEGTLQADYQGRVEYGNIDPWYAKRYYALNKNWMRVEQLKERAKEIDNAFQLIDDLRQLGSRIETIVDLYLTCSLSSEEPSENENTLNRMGRPADYPDDIPF